jgi:hypothetical protein
VLANIIIFQTPGLVILADGVIPLSKVFGNDGLREILLDRLFLLFACLVFLASIAGRLQSVPTSGLGCH